MPKVPKVLAVMGEATIKINAQLPRTAQLTVEMHRARATVERMAKALEAVLPRLAHPTRCGKVLPAAEWAQRGSVSFEGCDCEIAEARAALAAYKGESHE